VIVFSAFLVVVAVVLLVAGVVTSKLWLVYLAIGVSGVSLLALALGAILRRRELFGKTQEARPAPPPPVAAQVPSFHDDLGALPQPAAAPAGYGWSAAAQPGPPRAGYLPSDPPSRIRPPAAQPSPAWGSGLPPAASFPPAAGTTSAPAPGVWEWRDTPPATPPSAPPAPTPPPTEPQRPAAEPSATFAAFVPPAARAPAMPPAPSVPAEPLASLTPVDDQLPAAEQLLTEAQPPTEPALLPTEHVQPAPDEQTASEEEPAGQDHPAATDDRSPEAEPPPAPDEPTAAEPAAAEPATTDEATTPEPPQPAQDEPAQDEQPTAPEPPPLDAQEPAAASGTEPPPAEAETETETEAETETEVDLLRQVTVVPGVPRYHNAQCILIRFMGEDDLNRMTLGEARQAGCTPCRACQPDQPGAKPELPPPASQPRASVGSVARRRRLRRA